MFYTFKNNCEYEVQFVRGENEKSVVCFTKTKRYKKLCEPVVKHIELVTETLDYDQGKIGFSFDSVITLPRKLSHTHCILPKPYWNS